MADLEHEKNASRKIIQGLDFLAGFLDPHLPVETRNNSKERWSRGKAYVILLIVSLALWAMIIWCLIHFF